MSNDICNALVGLDILTPEQLADAMGCSVETVNEIAAARLVPAVKWGRSWRFPTRAMNQHLFDQAMNHVIQDVSPAANDERGSKRPDLTNVVRVGNG